MLYNRPTMLICEQCGLIRVSDTYHGAKTRAEQHAKLSKHTAYDLTILDECPGRLPCVAPSRKPGDATVAKRYPKDRLSPLDTVLCSQ
jgi:hypothetical protein